MIGKSIVVICAFLGAVYLLGRLKIAHNIALNVGGFNITWVLAGAIIVGVLAVGMKAS